MHIWTFNNITVISWWSVLLMEDTRGPGENHWPVASHCQNLSHNVVHLALIEIRIYNILPLTGQLKTTENAYLLNIYSWRNTIGYLWQWMEWNLIYVEQFLKEITYFILKHFTYENHWPVASHCQNLSHNVVHLALIEIRIYNIRGERHWLHR
jgi:hypothetical protein